jgi:hypothetical protein
VAFFAVAGVAGGGRLHASVSRSTRGMRALMQAPGSAMEFEMPLAPIGTAHCFEDRHLKELQELGHVPPPPPRPRPFFPDHF